MSVKSNSQFSKQAAMAFTVFILTTKESGLKLFRVCKNANASAEQSADQRTCGNS